MCGIAGILEPGSRFDGNELRKRAHRMAETLRHRGPDDISTWVDAEAGVGFGHTRLSVIDLSAAGAQPMISRCGRFVISYNGEVYNASELRDELAQVGKTFRGHSDTEVLVEGFATWGVRATVERLIGMFALAAWDRHTRTLTLVRDRLGIKPLYWRAEQGRVAFASELKALRVLPDWRFDIDRASLADFLRYGYVPTPRSIFQGVQKLEPGMLVEFRSQHAPKHQRYWSLYDVAHAGEASLLTLSDDEARDALDSLLTDATTRRMVADVPLGVFLSGGIDSSLVVALIQAHSSRAVRTFSIGFHERGYDEAVHARAVAAHLGTDHTELYVTPKQALDVVPRLSQMYDEPFADSSQIPTFLVSQLARRHVTVALSGDGGDELFAGYNRYAQGLWLHRGLRTLPNGLRRGLAHAIDALPSTAWDRAFDVVPARVRPRMAGHKMRKLAEVLHGDEAGYYQALISQWPGASSIVRGVTQSAQPVDDCRAAFASDLSWMQYRDSVTYLPDDILTKVDRASMAVSLEVRVPLLDHRVAELSWRLPPRMKVRSGEGKWLLRQVLYKYVPKKLVQRPKTGFGIPLDAWLRGPLHDWAADLLDPSAIRQAGFLDPGPIQEKWNEHQAGTRNWQSFLWNVLTFEAWRRSSVIEQRAPALIA